MTADRDVAVRTGQAVLVDVENLISEGAATLLHPDMIPPHLTSIGADQQAQLWYSKIAPF